jgi:hypothetical protein
VEEGGEEDVEEGAGDEPGEEEAEAGFGFHGGSAPCQCSEGPCFKSFERTVGKVCQSA